MSYICANAAKGIMRTANSAADPLPAGTGKCIQRIDFTRVLPVACDLRQPNAMFSLLSGKGPRPASPTSSHEGYCPGAADTLALSDARRDLTAKRDIGAPPLTARPAGRGRPRLRRDRRRPLSELCRAGREP